MLMYWMLKRSDQDLSVPTTSVVMADGKWGKRRKKEVIMSNRRKKK